MKVADLNNLAKIHDFGYNYNQNHSKVDREKLFSSTAAILATIGKKTLKWKLFKVHLFFVNNN